MAYSTASIGGVLCMVDPDYDHALTPYGKVVPAIDGTTFLHILQTNPSNIAYQGDLSINGLYLTTEDIDNLQNMSLGREEITVTGFPGVSSADRYLIRMIRQSAIKPGVKFPGEGEVVIRHNCSVTLTRVE